MGRVGWRTPAEPGELRLVTRALLRLVRPDARRRSWDPLTRALPPHSPAPKLAPGPAPGVVERPSWSRGSALALVGSAASLARGATAAATGAARRTRAIPETDAADLS